ncbi:hypothetical protein BB559_002640 [Furculomyces boomerangus]|uniref:Flap endonuclease 1 n=1 Tax=Furculomyces boomerangus TaxID=61424 RepID=A0A2T9YTL8_9FUNG|nr:hypothetical protein BB559_002640 [Furculomyces boomerangus]
MGIHGITKIITDHAPQAQKTNEIKAYLGRKVAIDASMSLYQFLVADDKNGREWDKARLAKRSDRRAATKESLKEAEEKGNQEEIQKFTRRLVKVTKEHNDDCKKLLRLMGIPVVEAPCEAEAMCAALAKSGKVWAAASEDMDTLCFGAPILLRRLTFSEAKKLPILEFHLDAILKGLELDKNQANLGILLGCDYCDTIKSVGPKTALSLIKKHHNIEEIIKNLTEKQIVPEDFDYQQVRQLFLNPDVTDPKEIDLVWKKPQTEEIVKFMCEQNGFNKDRILKGIEKLEKGIKQSQQGRLDSFFKVSSEPNKNKNKRKNDEKLDKKTKVKSTKAK